MRAAKVDGSLDYHHLGTRHPMHTLLMWKCFAPLSKKPIPKSYDEAEAISKVDKSLSVLDETFLGKTPYISIGRLKQMPMNPPSQTFRPTNK